MDLFHAGSGSPRESSDSRKSTARVAARNHAAQFAGPQLQPLFVKKHDATHLHYDLRLGFNDVFISFVLPDGPSYCPRDVCKAVEMEDHRREHAGFEGVIGPGRYGAGIVMLWDRGMWTPSPGYSDVDACLHKGLLKMTFYGERLKGDWTLARRDGSRKDGPGIVWTFIKEPDEFARTKDARSILEEQPNSVSTGRTLEQIERDWITGKRREPEPALF